MRIDELIPLRRLSDREIATFFALQEYPTGGIVQFPQKTEAQRWVLRFVLAAIHAGLAADVDDRTGWKRFADPVSWATSNWDKIGGNPQALRKRANHDGTRSVKKSHWWQLERRYRAATLKYGRWVWIPRDGRYIFAQGDGGEGAGGRWDMREAMGV